MEQRSPWVPAELWPFCSQHHKWSWPRPEWSAVRLPLCADSIRNNCILASLHPSAFTTVVWHLTVFLLHGPRAEGKTLQRRCFCYCNAIIFGWGVELERCWNSTKKKRKNKKSILSAATGSWDPRVSHVPAKRILDTSNPMTLPDVDFPMSLLAVISI